MPWAALENVLGLPDLMRSRDGGGVVLTLHALHSYVCQMIRYSD